MMTEGASTVWTPLGGARASYAGSIRMGSALSTSPTNRRVVTPSGRGPSWLDGTSSTSLVTTNDRKTCSISQNTAARERYPSDVAASVDSR